MIEELDEASRPIVEQALFNLVGCGYRLIDPDGVDMSEDLREAADRKSTAFVKNNWYKGSAYSPAKDVWYTEYQWRPKSDPRFGTDEGAGWFDANSREHALRMIELWSAEVRQRLCASDWIPFDPQTDEGAPASGPTPQAAAVSPAAPSSQTGDGAGAPPAPSVAGEATCTPAPSPPRRFRLIRLFDVSGVSGIGVVAEGVQFEDGAVALRWRGDHPSTVAWDSVAAVLAVHGHHGATELEWLDPIAAPDEIEGVPV